MTPHRTDRFSLADLMMVVLMCGLLAALVVSLEGPGNPAIISVLMGVVIFVWSIFKSMRTAAPCPECGRRVIRPGKKPGEVACPRCGQLQRGRGRSYTIARNLTFGLIIVLVVEVAITGILLNQAVGAPPTSGLVLAVGVAIASISVTVLIFLVIGAYRWFSFRPRDLACESCGAVIPAEQFFGPAECPFCRQRKSQSDQAPKPAANKAALGFAILGLMGVFLAVLLRAALGPWLGVNGWLGTALSILGLFAAVVVAAIALLLATIAMRFRRLKGEESAIAAARKYVKEDGEVVKDGPTTIWYSGPSDPVPMIREEMAIARDRFESLLSEQAVSQPQPRFRVLCFHDRAAFSRFHARNYALVNGMRTDGAYVFGWDGFATLCTGEAPCRVVDPAILVRSHYAYALLEGAQLVPPIPWLQVGINRKITHDGDKGELGRLNRRMVAALGRGTALSTELFAMASRDLIRLMQRRNDPREFQRFHQFHGQSWSVFEFLCGEPVPNDRRAALRKLLQDQRLKTHPEESFREQFGIGFDALLDDWRKWVLDQGIGTYDAPPARVCDTLLNRVIPVVRDRQSPREDRILAIRELGGQGYLLGADALIDLLRDGDDIPKEEVTWALSMISGLAGDAGPDRWQDWWDNLPVTGMEPLPCRSGSPA